MAGLMAVSMAGCSTPGSNVEKDSGTEGGGEEGAQKVFRYSITSDVSTLDPQKNNDSTSGTIGYHTGEGLTRSMDGVVHPGLARL